MDDVVVLRSERLRDLRQKQGFTQFTLSGAVGIDQSKISIYETGKQDPSLETLLKLCKVLSVTADYLLGLVDDPGKRLTDIELTPREYQLVLAHRNGDMKGLMQLASQPDS